MSVLLTSATYINGVLTPAGTTVSLGYIPEYNLVYGGSGTWVSIPNTPTPFPSYSPVSHGRKGALFTNFVTLGNWTSVSGPVLSSSTDSFSGQTSSMSCLLNATYSGFKQTFGTTFQITSGTALHLLVKLPDALLDKQSSNIIIRFSSDAAATKNLAFTFNNGYFRNSGWQVVTINTGETGTTSQYGNGWVSTGGQAWGDAFNYMDITFSGADYPTYSVLVDSIWLGAKDKPYITFSFDGSDASILSIVAPTLAAYGWAAANCVDGNNIVANLSMLQTLKNTYGWDIGTQGMNHTNYLTNPSLLAGNLATAISIQQANGLGTPSVFAYPSNASTTATDATLVANGNITCRRGGYIDILHQNGFGIPNKSDGVLVKQGYSQPLALNLAAIQARVDAVQQSGGVLSLFTHNVTTTVNNTLGFDLSSWYQLLEYIKSSGVEVIKPSDVNSRLQQTIWN
jgi:peptidoglycan/xylan/chitin deacetylase (PgdA/CDA1 family)